MLISGLKYSKNYENPKNSWINLQINNVKIIYNSTNQDDTGYFKIWLFFEKNCNYGEVI